MMHVGAASRRKRATTSATAVPPASAWLFTVQHRIWYGRDRDSNDYASNSERTPALVFLTCCTRRSSRWSVGRFAGRTPPFRR